LLRLDEITAVPVTERDVEAVRDLVGAREDARAIRCGCFASLVTRKSKSHPCQMTAKTSIDNLLSDIAASPKGAAPHSPKRSHGARERTVVAFSKHRIDTHLSRAAGIVRE
jgi:hypothetical protein